MPATSRLRAAFCALALTSAALAAQAPTEPAVRSRLVAVHATTAAQIREWDAAIDRMVRSRELTVLDSRADQDIEGRRHESLGQYHRGIPVYGAGLSRQTERGATVSIAGAIFDDVATGSDPTLGADEAVAALAAVTSGRHVGEAPQLVIFPTIGGEYRLAYRATMSDLKTYLVDAASGAVLAINEEVQTQSQVGIGIGVLGDRKKISTTQAAGGFRAHDQHRPAPIRTFDTRGSDATLNRLLQPPGAALDNDFAVDADNDWSDPAVVDAHVHSGWTEDYLFKQFNWTGLDNRRSTITSAVHSPLVSNAFFIGPPFGADRRGMLVYGRTPAGVPMTPLDIVAHEMMHGVTHAAVTERTGSGLLNILSVERFGPTAVAFEGASFSCNNTEVVLVDGRRLPLLCDTGRFVLVANHPGAINEAFSDIFGIGAEFFHHPAGSGPLRADYKMGEDLTSFGPNRAADDPASLTAMPSAAGPIRYPDHASRTFAFMAAISQGTRTNPIAIILLPWVISGSELVTLPSTDSGGVHVNATVLSHAFYLAIEGGRNPTSGLTVQGVGTANRAQIERAFFRAMVLMMPNNPSMRVAAEVIVQAAVDLHGGNGAATTAVRQAMQAVGLLN